MVEGDQFIVAPLFADDVLMQDLMLSLLYCRCLLSPSRCSVAVTPRLNALIVKNF